MSKLKDSGKRVTYEGGGQREPKPERFDLMSIVALYRKRGIIITGPRSMDRETGRKVLSFRLVSMQSSGTH